MSLLKRRRTDSISLKKALTDDEQAIYDVIISKENMGIVRAALKRELSSMKDQAFIKGVKSLIEKQKIKEVSTVQKKKVLMAKEIQPSSELTGGAWFSEGNLDTEFIEILTKGCMKAIRQQKVATLKSISEMFQRSGAFREAVPEDQINEILKTLVLDNEIMELKSNGCGEYATVPTGMVCYKIRKVKIDVEASDRTMAMVSIPCGACPRINQCTPDGAISPLTCVYYNKWLDF